MITPEFLSARSSIVPGQESVTYTPQNPVQKSFTVQGARKRPLDGGEAAAQGITVTIDKTTWILPASSMAEGFRPKAGDLITENPGTRTAVNWQVTPQGDSGLMEQEWKLISQLCRVEN